MVQNWPRPLVTCFTQAYIGKHEKILSQTAGHRIFILCMYHHAVVLYQVCSNDGPGAKGTPWGSHFLYSFI